MDTKTKAFSDEMRKLAISSMFPVNASGHINYITAYGQVKHLGLGQSFKRNSNAVVHNFTQPGAGVIVENNQIRV